MKQLKYDYGNHGVDYIYLVVFVGGGVLEEYDTLAVQTPIVPLSLLGLEKDGMRGGNKGLAAH